MAPVLEEWHERKEELSRCLSHTKMEQLEECMELPETLPADELEARVDCNRKLLAKWLKEVDAESLEELKENLFGKEQGEQRGAGRCTTTKRTMGISFS